MTEQRHKITISMRADLARSDLTRGLVWFVNYAAIDPSAVRAEDLDLHGAAMLPDDVEKLAHRWLRFSRSVDIEHDGIGRPVHPVESFFNSADVASNAWPVGAHVVRFDCADSSEAMEGLRAGTLNCVSFDAFTFNRVRRLPVAEARKSIGPIVPPKDVASIIEEVARMGYSGIDGAVEIAHGLYLIKRSSGLHLGVSIRDGAVEAAAAGGAWQHISAHLIESGSLVSETMRDFFPPHSGQKVLPIDTRVWDREKVDSELASRGIIMGSNLFSQMFAYVDPHGAGTLEHHVLLEDGSMAVSPEMVRAALQRVDDLPQGRREGARKHLLGHLEDIRRMGLGAA